MASLKTVGIDVVLLSMQEIAEIPDDVANDMLQAGGAVVAEAQRRKIRSVLKQHTGNLASSVTVTPKMKTRNGTERFVTVYPQGKHHTYNHKGSPKNATNNEVAFVQEYGSPKRGIKAKHIIRLANEESAQAATAAQYAIYENWLKSKGL